LSVGPIYIVTGLGFGDEGKGSVVDLLCRHTGTDLVVRHNGGGQAAHNVITPTGYHHTFAQLGSGSFLPEVRTLLSRKMIVNPVSFLNEWDVFEGNGPTLRDRILVDERALVTTPYHVFLNRARENARGVAKHGTTGMGISETVLDHQSRDAMTCVDLGISYKHALDRLVETRDALMPEMERLGAKADFERLSPTKIAQYFMEFTDRVHLLSGADVELAMHASKGGIVFEGAQGVLLDEDFGFHPHTTWSKTTPDNAQELLQENGLDGQYTVIGVTRCYATRHGAGPFPTEHFGLHFDELHNKDDGMAGQFRQGYLSISLLKYAEQCCGRIDKLAVNHLDYNPSLYYPENDEANGWLVVPRSRRDQEVLCRRAFSVAAKQLWDAAPVPKTGFAELIAEQLELPLLVKGAGPMAGGKQIVGKL